MTSISADSPGERGGEAGRPLGPAPSRRRNRHGEAGHSGRVGKKKKRGVGSKLLEKLRKKTAVRKKKKERKRVVSGWTQHGLGGEKGRKAAKVAADNRRERRERGGEYRLSISRLF